MDKENLSFNGVGELVEVLNKKYFRRNYMGVVKVREQ